MFKKLKDKIAEEVKSSPQRLQQLTQSVTEKIQNATSDESFFSIGEDDSSTPEPGFSNVSLSNISTPQSGHIRKNSNSSIASDISFLPRYESSSNLYHLQSDLDISASEVEDNVSTSSQLGHLTKEQIYAAFQKAQMRYHKYRGRYSDIASYYKELEKENAKIKVVLVETQDKALRRVAELREQCSLEQKAKAHLENALRLELDEKQYVIDTLKTKVNLLQRKNSNPDKSDVLINLDDAKNLSNIETLTNDLKAAQNEIESLNSRLQEMKANTIVLNSKEADLKKKIVELEEINKKNAVETEEILERERENNLIIAQTKMELHTEIQNRDLEIQNLKHDLEITKADLEGYENKTKSTKLENLHSQNSKLIEKIEGLTQKCQGYESELLKLEQLKIENENSKQASQTNLEDEVLRLQNEIEQQQTKHDNDIAAYREDTKKHLLGLETKIKEKLEAERNEREHNLKAEFEEKLRQITTSTETAQETQIKLVQKEDEVKSLANTIQKLEADLVSLNAKYDDLEKNHLELITENSDTHSTLKTTLKKLQDLEINIPKQKDELIILQSDNARLTDEISRAQAEIADLQKENLKVSTEASDLQTSLGKLKDDNSKLQQEILNVAAKIVDLEGNNSKYETEKANLRTQFESLLIENDHLKKEIVNLQSTTNNLNKTVTNAEILEKEIAQLHQNLAQSPTDLLHIKFENTILNELNVSISKLTTLQDQVRELSEKNANLQHDLNIRNNDQSKEELAKAKLAFQKKFKEQKAKFHTDIQKLNTEVLAFKEKNEQIQSYIEDYKQKLNEYETASLQKTTQLQEIITENESLKQQLEKSDENTQTLAHETETVRLELKKRNEENNRLTAELQTILDENNNLNNAVSNKDEEMATLRTRLEKSESDLKSLYEDFTRLETTLAEHKTHIVRLEELENVYKNSSSASEDTIINLKQEIDKLKTESSTAKSNYQEDKIKLVSENSELLNINLELKQEVAKYESAKSVLEKELSSLKSCANNSEVENNELSKVNSELLKSNGDLNEQLQKCNFNLQLIEEERKSFENKSSQLETLIEKLTNENRQLQSNVSNLQQEMTTLNETVTTHSQITDDYNRSLEEITELKSRNNELALDIKQTMQENDSLLHDLAEVKLKYETLNLEKTKWESNEYKISELQLQLDEIKNEEFDKFEIDNFKVENKRLKVQVQNLEEKNERYEKEKRQLETQLRDLENQFTEITHERQFLKDEIQELKISPININSHINNTETADTEIQKLHEDHEKEINDLNEKLIQYKSLDLTNRSSIQFYENELQKLKNKNEKINRKLDETLVTLNHCTELSTSTETEYLRNVLYNYMLGKESLVLARVIAAVCKFDDIQTEAILQREQQKQTLLGQLGFR